jgi:hypothetical protein
MFECDYENIFDKLTTMNRDDAKIYYNETFWIVPLEIDAFAAMEKSLNKIADLPYNEGMDAVGYYMQAEYYKKRLVLAKKHYKKVVALAKKIYSEEELLELGYRN